MPNGQITIAGNLADDPELRFTPSGAAVAAFRVGVTERYRDNSGEWKDRDTSWYSVQCWRDLAEHVAESFVRGSRVIVSGTMRQRSYETRDGEKRYVWELHADEIGASVRYATVKIHKTARGPAVEDPWNDANGGNGAQAEPAASGPESAAERPTGAVKARASDRGKTAAGK